MTFKSFSGDKYITLCVKDTDTKEYVDKVSIPVMEYTDTEAYLPCIVKYIDKSDTEDYINTIDKFIDIENYSEEKNKDAIQIKVNLYNQTITCYGATFEMEEGNESITFIKRVLNEIRYRNSYIFEMCDSRDLLNTIMKLFIVLDIKEYVNSYNHILKAEYTANDLLGVKNMVIKDTVDIFRENVSIITELFDSDLDSIFA